MNASDSRPEQEITDLAQLLPVPADRELAAGRHLLLKEHLMAEIQAAHPGFHAIRRPSLGRGTIAIAAGIAVLAIMLTATTLGTLARSAGTVSPAGSAGPPPSPSTLLHKIATAAGRARAVRPRANQFSYVANDIAHGHRKLAERQVWTPVSNLCKGISTADGGSPIVTLFPAGHCPDRGRIGGYPTYRLLRSLPTQPGKLLADIAATIGKAPHLDMRVMLTISNLLINATAPPKFTAALYRVAAGMHGLHVVQAVTDPDGRPGIGLIFNGGGARIEWVFNSKTLRLIGERISFAKDSKGDMRFAALNRAFVNHGGQVGPLVRIS